MNRALFVSLALAACDVAETTPTEPEVCEPVEVSCVDAMLLDLSLHELVSVGEVTNRVEEPGFISRVDATAGGFQAAASNPWIYLRFTEVGLERIEIDDVEALSSTAWHFAAHRFKLRLNGGASGPSCVGAAALFDRAGSDLSAEDAASATFFVDDFYTPSCALINDSSGLEGSPQVALGPWWSYPNCVATTGTPFLIRLEDERLVRLEVLSYYGQNQETCDTAGAPGIDGANYRFRWSFL